MTCRRRAVLLLIAGCVAMSPASAVAAPPGMVKKCSDVEYRQDHLSECNQQGSPFLLGGGGGAGGGGLLGAIRRTLGGLL